ncbi:MAG: hypothetical protein QOF02_1546 [Blastocatellia bacterium]|jgi:hypothetical protein|nr:hypothetical protein [Blastocatellia bacterium]
MSELDVSNVAFALRPISAPEVEATIEAPLQTVERRSSFFTLRFVTLQALHRSKL